MTRRAPQLMQRRLSSNTFPPTGSNTTSAPRPPVSSFTRSRNGSPDGNTWSAPRAFATARFSSLEASAITVAP